MAIDQQRYDDFRDELQALSTGLSPRETFATLRAKLVDLFNRAGLDAAQSLRLRRIIGQAVGEELDPLIERIIQSYSDTLDLVNLYYADLGVDVTRQFTRIQAIERVNLDELGRYKASTIEDIENAVRRVLTGTGRVRDLRDELTALGGKAANYADVIANTQIKAVGRVAKAEKARVADVRYYQYVGIIRSTTRPFCRVLVGKTHHIDTIRQMDNGNRNPVLTYCGGWNCIHDWEPDPFATTSDEDNPELVGIEDGNQTILVPGGEDARSAYQQAQETAPA